MRRRRYRVLRRSARGGGPLGNQAKRLNFLGTNEPLGRAGAEMSRFHTPLGLLRETGVWAQRRPVGIGRHGELLRSTYNGRPPKISAYSPDDVVGESAQVYRAGAMLNERLSTLEADSTRCETFYKKPRGRATWRDYSPSESKYKRILFPCQAGYRSPTRDSYIWRCERRNPSFARLVGAASRKTHMAE